MLLDLGSSDAVSADAKRGDLDAVPEADADDALLSRLLLGVDPATLETPRAADRPPAWPVAAAFAASCTASCSSCYYPGGRDRSGTFARAPARKAHSL